MEVFATLCDFGDIIPHDTDSVVDLTLDRGRLGVAARLGSRARRGAATGQVRVIGFGPVQCSHSVRFVRASLGRCGRMVGSGEGHVSIVIGNDHARSALRGAWRLVCLHIFDLELKGLVSLVLSSVLVSKVGSISLRDGQGWIGLLLGSFLQHNWRLAQVIQASEVFSKNGGWLTLNSLSLPPCHPQLLQCPSSQSQSP